MKTITELLRGIDPVKVAEQVAGIAPEATTSEVESEELEKDASADLLSGLEIEASTNKPELDPDQLEKLASKIEQAISALELIRPDLDLEEILSLEGRRILAGRTLNNLDDIPQLKKEASKRKVNSGEWENILAAIRRRTKTEDRE